MGSAGVEEFEKHREEMEAAEQESRRVKEMLRDATKAFKSAALPTPPKEDRKRVENRYSEIKENLARAKLEWREALARSRMHEAGKVVSGRKAEVESFLAHLIASKVSADEFEAFERQQLLKFEELLTSVGFALKAAKELGLDKVKETDQFLADARKQFNDFMVARKGEFRAHNEAARKLADLLSAYAKWSQDTLRDLQTVRPEHATESVKELDKRLQEIVNLSEAKIREMSDLKVKKVPQLDPVHHEIIVACQKFKSSLIASKRNSSRILKMKRDSGLHEEAGVEPAPAPAFAQESPLAASMGQIALVNLFKMRLAQGGAVWTEKEVRQVLVSQKVDFQALSGSEFELVTKDFAIAVAREHQSRTDEENDILFQLSNRLFERAIYVNPRSMDLKLNGAANIMNWASLRLDMEHLVYKGQAVFPILEKALLWLDSAMAQPNADQAKIRDRAQSIDALRKRTKDLDDSTSSRMRAVIEKQNVELQQLEAYAARLLQMK